MKKGKFILPLILTSFLMSNCASVSNFLDYREKEFEIYDCLKKTSKIQNIPEKKISDKLVMDYWETPKETEKIKKVDCDGKTFYLHYELFKKKIKAQVVYGQRFPNDISKHLWIHLYKGDELYILDPNFGSGWIYKKRKDINKSNYVPYDQDPKLNKFENYVLNKFEDYIRRIRQEDKNITGNDINPIYNFLINRRQTRR